MSFTTDLRHAIRMLRVNPGFAAVAIFTLALGIGATTAMFTVVNGVVLKSLRYPDADRIVAVDTKFTDEGRAIWRVTGGDMEDLRADQDSFEAFTFSNGGEMGVQLASAAEFVSAYLVDPEFFRVFSIPPVAGRTFAGDDAGRTAIVGLGFAQRNFGSASSALGQTVGLDGKRYEIVGVMPAMFDYPQKTQVWLAVSPIPEIRNRSAYNYHAVAKLRAGVSLAAANARMQALGGRLSAAFPQENHDKTFELRPLREQLAAPVRSTVFLLLGAVGLVLLIACANVANLMLARATARSRELAVRAALGAGRRRIISQLLTESSVLAIVAGGIGVGLAAWGTKALLAVGAHFIPAALLGDITLDWRVLAFALTASLLTSILFGVAPVWHATRVDLQDALKQGGTRGLLGGGPSYLRNSLVVAQIALSLMLAIGAGLLFRTMLALHSAELGYRTEGILVAYAHAPAHNLPEALQAGQFFDDLFARLRRLPGVVSAVGAMGLPSGQYGSDGYFAVEGKHTFGGDYRKLPYAGFRLASPGYFSTMGIPLLSGRDFSGEDLYDRPQVAMISETLARQIFPNEDPVGHRVTCGFDDASMKGMTIVGVVGDVRQDSPAARPGPELYMPLRQHPYMANEAQVVVRTAGNPEAFVPAVQKTIREMRPEVATKFTTMTETVNDSIRAQRFRAVLASSFAVLSLLLALSGMYAVMSYLTLRRTSEFGLRSALGALPGNIIWLVLGSAARLGAIGVVLGVLLSIATSRLLSSVLFGLKNTDLATYAAVTAIVLPVIVLAAALPARRASLVDPVIALRNE
ncbi:MAG TPA: ABC transporter permease [Candidatus Sulfotelmatobacter sp.]|nr:ABC transporter permease [Candidatus Sulfotelmatobacter sp.]